MEIPRENLLEPALCIARISAVWSKHGQSDGHSVSN
jgi:hypothetical protein